VALTLAEASKLSNDVLLAGVIETIIKDSPILQSLPLIEIEGSRASCPQSRKHGGSVTLAGGCERPEERAQT
jgi:hypothetical protein